MTITLPKNVKYILDTLEKNGASAYVVGGAIRSSILGVSIKDWDIATNFIPEQVKKSFRGFKTIDTGIKHGTITLVIGDDTYEITTFRSDGEYLDNRRPVDVEFVSNILEDLARRDFTINSLYSSQKTKKILDFHNGLNDLTHKIVRFIGNPKIRIIEDPLRIIRALRFALTLNFTIEKKSLDAIKKSFNLTKKLTKKQIFFWYPHKNPCPNSNLGG